MNFLYATISSTIRWLFQPRVFELKSTSRAQTATIKRSLPIPVERFVIPHFPYKTRLALQDIYGVDQVSQPLGNKANYALMKGGGRFGIILFHLFQGLR